MADKKINISFSVIGEEAAQKLRDVSTGIESVKNNAQKTTPTIKDNELEEKCWTEFIDALSPSELNLLYNMIYDETKQTETDKKK